MNDADAYSAPRWLPPLVVVLLGAVAQGSALGAPLNAVEINAGAYFGCFLQNFEAHGFAALRGMPLAPQLVADPLQAAPYFNHPPGLTWLAWLLGGGELGLRAPTAAGALVAALALYGLLRPRTGAWPAAMAGLALAWSPAMAFWLRASYEPAVLPCGLLTWLASERLLDGDVRGARRMAWRTVQLAACVLGTWMDWAFLFFCVGLVCLVIRRDVRRTLLALLPPALATVTALALFFAWRGWAAAADHLPDPDAQQSAAALLQRYVLDRPGVADYLTHGGGVLQATIGAPMLWAGLATLPVLLWRRPRLGLALLCGALLHPLVFAKHALDHVHFWGYAAALMPAAVASLATLRWRHGRAAVIAVLVALAAAGGWRSWSLREATATDLYATVGEVLTAAAGSAGDSVLVATNFPHVYSLYVDSPRVVVPMIVDPRMIEGYRTSASGRDGGGVRYLQVRVEGPGVDDGTLVYHQPRPALAAYLDGFARVAVPELVGRRLYEPMFDARATITGAWLVTVAP